MIRMCNWWNFLYPSHSFRCFSEAKRDPMWFDRVRLSFVIFVYVNLLKRFSIFYSLHIWETGILLCHTSMLLCAMLCVHKTKDAISFNTILCTWAQLIRFEFVFYNKRKKCTISTRIWINKSPILMQSLNTTTATKWKKNWFTQKGTKAMKVLYVHWNMSTVHTLHTHIHVFDLFERQKKSKAIGKETFFLSYEFDPLCI